MARIIILTNLERQQIMLEQARIDLEEEGKLKGGSRVLLLNDGSVWGPECQGLFAKSEMVLFSWIGTSYETHFFKKAIQLLRGKAIPYVMLATNPNPADSSYAVLPEEQETMRNYLQYSGMENYRHLWLWMAGKYCGEDMQYQMPQPSLWNGIFHPRAAKPYTDTVAYQHDFCQPGRPTVGIAFSREDWIWGDLAYQTALVEEIERQGMNAIAVFSPWAHNDELDVSGVGEVAQTYFYVQGVPVLDVLLNTFKVALTIGQKDGTGFLNDLDVPVLQAYGLLRSSQEWEDSMEGMTPTEISCNIAMPEFDGVIHALPVASKEKMPDGTKKYKPIPERLSAVVRKAGKWARLRRKANAEKKIAIIFHNYPPDNSSIASAQGLDSPASVCLLLERMAERGYCVKHIPADSRELMAEVVAEATNDRRFLTGNQIRRAPGKVSESDYRQLFDHFAPETQEQMTTAWGPPPGEVFHYDDILLVPGLMNGNIFITVQPPRGFGEDPSKILHSPDCPPPHHYLACYHWIRDIWQADAVVHVGTHGSLEWLPGKGAGLSRRCYPDLALGDLPDVYPYLITIVGEGLQAKRRGAACLIGHLPPPMSHADTYEDLAELETFLDEYAHFKLNNPGNLATVTGRIREKIADMHLTEDLPEQPGQSFDEYMQRLHRYVTEIKNMQIRVGLHVLGCPPQGEKLTEYLLALTRMDNGDIPSLPKTIANAYGYDYYELVRQSGKLLTDGSKTYAALLDDIWGYCREAVTFLAVHDFAEEQIEGVFALPWAGKMGQPFTDRLLHTLAYICRTLAPNLQKTEREIANVLAALGSEFIEPGPAGAPTSGKADILPTGRNFYGVDPRTLPSPTSWELGKVLGDHVIERYIAEEGCYPENIGMVLWCDANMRSHGQCVAEFLYLMGVRPVWQKGSLRVIGLRVIPLAELKRPRIDVTARISGLFRDALPASVEWMDQAVKLIAGLDESLDMNYVRRHTLE
ncbi:MAG: cobaltochelatase subunit CobN, partial [Veillonellales bacterium]